MLENWKADLNTEPYPNRCEHLYNWTYIVACDGVEDWMCKRCFATAFGAVADRAEAVYYLPAGGRRVKFDIRVDGWAFPIVDDGFQLEDHVGLGSQ